MHAETIARGIGFSTGRTAQPTSLAFTTQFAHSPLDVDIAHRRHRLGRTAPSQKGVGNDSRYNQGQQDKDGDAHD
jgi:hypothetical protein